MAVRIVTDSTSDIRSEVAQRLDVAVIAQNVHFGTETYKDNVTTTPDDFYSMLASSPELPKTSQASPGDFKNTFDELGVDADGIVSIHVSSKISGTYNSAVQGAAMTLAKCPVEVIDSEQASMGLGLIVVAAAEAAHRGAGPRRPTAALCTPRRVGPTCSMMVRATSCQRDSATQPQGRRSRSHSGSPPSAGALWPSPRSWRLRS